MADTSDAERLLACYFEGTATPQEVTDLGLLLVNDVKFAERASELSLLHYQIGEIYVEDGFHALLDRYSGDRDKLPDAILRHAKPSGPPASGAISQLVSRRLAWIAATCASLAAIGLLFFGNPTSPQRTPFALSVNPLESTAPVESVATITQLSEIAWAVEGSAFVTGEALSPNSRLRLKSGLAKLTFECGAEVVLQGPCDFVVRDEMVGVLHQGKLAANVPRRAFSFAIRSPEVDIIDLGTSFGISVEDTGKSELHVFEGEVLYSKPRTPATKFRNPSVHVLSNQAVGFADGDSQSIVYDDHQFLPLLAMRKAAASKSVLPVDDELALWLSADTGISVDELDRVVAWQDIVTDVNRSGEDATQHDPDARPKWVEDAFQGNPGVRFNGSSDYLITTPLETTDNQTVFLVTQFSERAFESDRQWGGQILNYDGPPGREASNTFAPGILQIGEPLLAEDFSPSLITGQVFAGFIGSAVVESGRVDATALGPNQPAIVCYQYDYTQGKSQLQINGQLLGTARAFAPQALTSRKIIGRHAWRELFFGGDLGELLIYNEALSLEEIALVSSYLASKYGITLATP